MSKILSEEEMVKAHTPLVASIAFRFRPQPPNDHEDLISIGMIGLLKAIRAFDPKRGNQFSTLASIIIEREIVRELEKSNGKDQENIEFDIEQTESNGFEDYLPENLTDIERKILMYRFYYGYTFEEIGKELHYTKQWANAKLKSILGKISESNEKKKDTLAE